MSPLRIHFCTSVLVALATGCTNTTTTAPDTDPGEVAPAPAEPVNLDGAIGEVYSAMDTSADPCQDFYQYACGGWLASNEIPADKPMAARIVGIDDRTKELLKEVLEDAAANPGDDANKKKIGDYYAGCMDQGARDEAGLKPLQPALDQIAKVKNLQTAMETAAKLSPYGVDGYVGGGVEPDAKDPNTNLLSLYQAGLGLPNRDFYLGDDEQSKQLVAMYEQHVAGLLAVLGDTPEDAAKWAKEIVALETKLAEVSVPLEVLRDVDNSYNKMDLKGLRKMAPKVKWARVFSAAGMKDVKEVNIATPKFFTEATKILAKTDKKLLQAHLRLQLVSSSAGDLTEAIAQQNFQFAAILTGQQSLPDPWKRCVDSTVGVMPELVGPYYVEKAFAGDSKKVALEMIQSVEKAFEGGLSGLDWMDDTTRGRARGKAGAIVNKVGYPDKWRSYDKVSVDRGAYFQSMISATTVDFERQLAKVGKPVDKTEWFMPPSMLNAYANPAGMEMVFPAGILQAPLFSTELPMAVNYGAIGSIMGHELTHHFDDQGAKFNASGAMEQWWEPAVQKNFENKAACVTKAYDAFEAAPGLNVNGQQTLGENIADIGGLKAAHAAYMAWSKDNPEESPIPGVTAEQLLFVAYGQNWCMKMAPQMEKVQVLSDVHSPAKFRAIGGVTNNPAFWAAFSCEAGTPMHPENACEVW